MKRKSAKDLSEVIHDVITRSYVSSGETHTHHVHEDEDSGLYCDDEIVESLDRARSQMTQGKFISKENVLEDV